MKIKTVLITVWLGTVVPVAFGQGAPYHPAPSLVPLGLFELNDEQRRVVRQAQREYHARRCDITGRMLEAQEDIRALYARAERDPKQVGQAFRALATLQQQLLEARIEAENRAEAALSETQRRQLRARRMGRLDRAYPEWLPYTMHPGIQEERFVPRDLEEPAQSPVPPRHETVGPP